MYKIPEDQKGNNKIIRIKPYGKKEQAELKDGTTTTTNHNMLEQIF